MTHMTIDTKEALALLRSRRALWSAAFLGGAVVAMGAGVLFTREVQRRHKLPPVKGAYESIKVEGKELVGGTTVRLTFAEEWMDAYAGGNDMTGTILMNGATLHWNEEDATNAGCMPDVAVQDAWLSGWLNRGVTLFRDHKRLVLSGGGIKIVFRRLSEED
jgi:heat shock protein HslJ